MYVILVRDTPAHHCGAKKESATDSSSGKARGIEKGIESEACHRLHCHGAFGTTPKGSALYARYTGSDGSAAAASPYICV